MTDYLEESLDHAGRLLEQIRKLERELPGLEPENGGNGENRENRENGGVVEDSGPDTPQKRDVSGADFEVYNRVKNVDQNIISVDNGRNTPEIGVKDPKNNVNHLEKMGGELELLHRTAVSLAGETTTDIRQAAEDGPEREGEALAARLKQLDKASAIPAGKARAEGDEPGRRGAYPVSLSRPQGGAGVFPAAGGAEEAWSVSAGPEQGRAPSGGGTGWMEQADRAFCRDSRRYDGGFYLY